MSTCRTCTHWTASGVPRWAFNMGMACCALKNTKAVTLNNWAACGQHKPAPAGDLPKRDEWLKRCGIEVAQAPRSGSFQQTSTAGHSRREGGLFHGAAKGVK